MKEVIFEKNFNTPEVIYDQVESKLIIKGICTPENPRLFFEPIIKKVSELKSLNESWIMEIALHYFNSATNKVLLNILNEAGNDNANKHFRVKWFYEDSEAMESGLLLEELSGVPFDFEKM